ncbi:phosphatase [Microlunatus endophyticus]|uniref:Phosphatase n=1 Tax=Microlunatus endophyticus TaxID=1716077 RepID=A0A917S281_9ACTN|nr:metallophosphoesterase [Microlunatus endophyticus]GGL49027.1 phosphatase [Microlunatus endophyticus]
MTDPIFSFGLLADVQYADDPTDIDTGRHYRESPGKLRAAVDDFNSQDLAFVAHLGDFVDHDLANADRLLTITADLSVPFHQVLGNHDFASTSSTTGRSDPADVLRAYGLPTAYYAFDQPGWRFLVLDTNEVGVIEYPPGSPQAADGEALLGRIRGQRRSNARPWNGTIGAVQRQWLADQLQDAGENGLRAAVLAHHAVCPDHHDNLLDDHELRDWLADFGALAVWFNGHQHAGGYGRDRGIHYLTLHGVVQGSSNAYAVAEVHPDRIVIIGSGRQPSYELLLD